MNTDDLKNETPADAKPVLADSALDDEQECLKAVQRWQEYMRPLITIVSEEDGVLLRIRDVGRMLLACEKHFR